MDKITRKTSFEQWFSPISTEKMQEYVESHQLNFYTMKLYMASFLKILLYAQLNETESIRAVRDAMFSEELQQLTDLDSISNSQLGRRLNQVPTEFFQQIFLDLVAQIHMKTELIPVRCH